MNLVLGFLASVSCCYAFVDFDCSCLITTPIDISFGATTSHTVYTRALCSISSESSGQPLLTTTTTTTLIFNTLAKQRPPQCLLTLQAYLPVAVATDNINLTADESITFSC